jgi:hypothetical protein
MTEDACSRQIKGKDDWETRAHFNDIHGASRPFCGHGGNGDKKLGLQELEFVRS